ncbi:MAG: type IV pilus secretin PilQ [Deltaproteobacteria bacterium]|nr:type IV pilus secretin PilQ [Deltaproteobacteria bacterium]
MNMQNKIIHLVALVVVGVLFFGCAGTKKTKKDPFFEKWKIMAQESKGNSPAAKIRKIKIPPEPGYKLDGIPMEERSLPTDNVNFKMRNVDVKMVLQALARAANENILVKSEVQGRVSVDFKNVPWDKAFRSILSSQALTYVWEGNIIRIATVEDLEKEMQLKLIQDKKKEKAPLVPMVVPIDFADPKKLGENLSGFLTKDDKGNPYGSMKVSDHTNSLIIQATREDLRKIIPMLEKIDKPIPQILIQANIIETTKDTARSLGIQWGGMYSNTVNSNQFFITPGGTGGTVGTNPASAGGYSPTYGSSGVSGHGYGVNFPASAASISAAGGAGSLGLMFGKIGGSILDMQLTALQNDGKLNILSSPSITTLDNQAAFTENGEKVPYVSIDKDGNREVKFEDVVLRLEITPHVIDGIHLKMKINVKKDEINESRTVQGNPAIFRKQTDTTLIVRDGETIVISGLTKKKSQDKNSGIPGFKDVPVLGWLFKGDYKAEDMEEVLIFITPHILKTAAAEEEAVVPEQKREDKKHQESGVED